MKQAELEHQYALAGVLTAVEGRLTQLVDSIRGQVVNGVLFAGTVQLDATSGTYTMDFEVPFGSVAVGNGGIGTLTFQNDGVQVSAPTTGVGVFTVEPGKQATVPVAGRALTLYGVPGTLVQLNVYDRPLGAASLGNGGASSIGVAPLEYSGSVSAAGVLPLTQANSLAAARADGSIEVKGRWVSVQLTGAWVGTVQFETSNDGATWVGCALVTSASTSAAATVAAAGNALLHGPVPGRYFRVRCSAYTSGTIAAVVEDFPTTLGAVATAQSVSTTNTGADGASTTLTGSTVAAEGFAFNGSTWDRIRSAAGALFASANGFAQHVATGAVTKQTLTAQAAGGAGAVLDNNVARKDHTLHITVNGVASVKLELSLDGTTFTAADLVAVAGSGATVVGGAATTTGLYTALGVPARAVRANITAYTSGATTAFVTSS